MKTRIAFDLERAATLWAEGGTLIDIAAKLGVSSSTFSRAMEEDRVRFPRRRQANAVDAKTALRKTRASLLLAQGKTVSEVAEEMGIDRTSIYRWAVSDPDKFPDLSGARRARAVPPRGTASSKLAGARSTKAEPAIAKAPVAEPTPSVDALAEKVDAGVIQAPIAADPVDVAPAGAPSAPQHEADVRPAGAAAFRPLPGTTPARLWDAKGCRWPVHVDGGDPFRTNTTFVCDAPKCGDKLPYCATHRAVHGRPAVTGGHFALRTLRAVA